MRHRITAGLAVAAIMGGLVFGSTAIAQAAPLADGLPSGGVVGELLPLTDGVLGTLLGKPGDIIGRVLPSGILGG